MTNEGLTIYADSHLELLEYKIAKCATNTKLYHNFKFDLSKILF